MQFRRILEDSGTACVRLLNPTIKSNSVHVTVARFMGLGFKAPYLGFNGIITVACGCQHRGEHLGDERLRGAHGCLGFVGGLVVD